MKTDTALFSRHVFNEAQPRKPSGDFDGVYISPRLIQAELARLEAKIVLPRGYDVDVLVDPSSPSIFAPLHCTPAQRQIVVRDKCMVTGEPFEYALPQEALRQQLREINLPPVRDSNSLRLLAGVKAAQWEIEWLTSQHPWRSMSWSVQ